MRTYRRDSRQISYVVVLHAVDLRPVLLAPLADPGPELVLAQDAQHVLHPLLALLRDLVDVGEVVVEGAPLLDEGDQVGHVEALDLRAVGLLDGVVLHVPLLARHDVVHQVPIGVRRRLTK